MKIAVGCDPNAEELKQAILVLINTLGYEYTDFGSQDIIYANVSIEVAKSVADRNHDRGILLCGTGIGVSISANKVKGAYAALASSTYAAKKAVTSNKANILCIGACTTGKDVALSIVQSYLSTEYVPGTPSEEKLARYVAYDKNAK